MTLYEINEAILGCVDAETGEVLNGEALDQLEMVREEKMEGTALWVKDLRAEASAIAAEEKALAERRKALEKKADSVEGWLAVALDGQKFETSRCKISWRKSEAVEITSEDDVIAWASINDESLLDYKVSVKKTELKKLLKAGETIGGAEIIEKNNMSIK